MTRPYLTKVHRWEWRDHTTGTSTPGIALRQGHRIIVHLTPAEAIKLSNRLVDLAEKVKGNHDPRQTNRI